MRAQNTRVGGRWLCEQRQVLDVEGKEAGEVVVMAEVKPATIKLVDLLPVAILPALREWYQTLPARRLAA